MKEKIQQINQSIEEKRIRLVEKVERYFSSITIPTHASFTRNNSASTSKTPPIAYMLYGVAGLCAIGAFSTASTSKVLCLGITALASAFGGHKLSNVTKVSSTARVSSSEDIKSLKFNVTDKVLEVVKKTLKEWDNFMELKQKELRQYIVLSKDYSETQKDEMMAKIFLYEVVNIKLSEFSDMLAEVSSISDMKEKIDAYKVKLQQAVDDAANRQMVKYKSIEVSYK